METAINDIIGSGKDFEPPFSVVTDFEKAIICDKNDLIFATVSILWLDDAGRSSIAQHICDLLNQEHCGKGGEG